MKTQYPIIQAPMAGGATTPELVAAVCNAGGLGSLGAGYMQPEALRQAIHDIRQLTDKPFQVNVFVPSQPQVSTRQMQEACQAISESCKPLGIAVEPVKAPYAPDFDQQVAVLLEERVDIVSFTFGLPARSVIDALKSKDVFLIAGASTVAEAQCIEQAGFDALVVQGQEAGGHRVSFLEKEEVSLHPLDELLVNVLSSVTIPVIAAGGLMCGDDINRVLSLGASAAQLGTAFLTTDEAGISEVYKSTLLEQSDDNTVLTRAFSGRLARGINNAFTKAMQYHVDSIVDYPVQNKLTGPMRKLANQQGDKNYLSLWAGRRAFMARRLAAAALMRSLVAELRSAAD